MPDYIPTSTTPSPTPSSTTQPHWNGTTTTLDPPNKQIAEIAAATIALSFTSIPFLYWIGAKTYARLSRYSINAAKFAKDRTAETLDEVLSHLIDVQTQQNTIRNAQMFKSAAQAENFLMQSEALNPGGTFSDYQVECIVALLGEDSMRIWRRQYVPNPPGWVLRYNPFAPEEVVRPEGPRRNKPKTKTKQRGPRTTTKADKSKGRDTTAMNTHTDKHSQTLDPDTILPKSGRFTMPSSLIDPSLLTHKPTSPTHPHQTSTTPIRETILPESRHSTESSSITDPSLTTHELTLNPSLINPSLTHGRPTLTPKPTTTPKRTPTPAAQTLAPKPPCLLDAMVDCCVQKFGYVVECYD